MKSKTPLEVIFRNIVALCHDATGGNGAFEPEYGLDTLNQIRGELGLPQISQKQMTVLLNGD